MGEEITESEALFQVSQLKGFLTIARAVLQNVDIPLLIQECERFDAFAPFFQPTQWIDGRKSNREFKEWLEAIAPLAAKLKTYSQEKEQKGAE